MRAISKSRLEERFPSGKCNRLMNTLGAVRDVGGLCCGWWKNMSWFLDRFTVREKERVYNAWCELCDGQLKGRYPRSTVSLHTCSTTGKELTDDRGCLPNRIARDGRRLLQN